jgi:hypothetical protein
MYGDCFCANTSTAVAGGSESVGQANVSMGTVSACTRSEPNSVATAVLKGQRCVRLSRVLRYAIA